MDAIEKMIERMKEQAKAERQALKEERLNEIEADFAKEQALLVTEKTTQLEKQTNQIERKYKQQRDRQQVAFRQAALHEKQRVLQQFFENATHEMNAWSKTQKQDFCENMLQTSQLKQPLTLTAGEFSKAYLDQTWVEKMNQKLGMQLTLSEEIVAQQSGFILDDNGIRYNFVFENLINDVQTTMGFELAKRLFE